MRYLHTMVRVGDLKEALDLYCAKLGLKELRRVESKAGRFTLVFLATPEDAANGAGDGVPMVELTWNWDEQAYGGGRNFGHLPYRVPDPYPFCRRLMDPRAPINPPPRDSHLAPLRPPH